MKLTISHNPPPIPARQFDWQCIDQDTYDGASDSRGVARIIGFGMTERAAVEDWRQQWAEAHGAADWNEYADYEESKSQERNHDEWDWENDWNYVGSRWHY